MADIKGLLCWDSRKLSDISQFEVKELHERETKEKGPYQANRTLERIRGMYNWAIREEGWAGSNPAVGIQAAVDELDTRLDNLNTGNLSASGALTLSGIISPAQLTADTHDWNPTGLASASAIRVSTDAARTITGIAGGSAGRVDLQGLYDLSQIWNSRGDTFDGVFDQKLTVWEALSRVARCGRSVLFLQGGVVRFVRDEPRSLPVALFSPRNIVKGSFRIEYVMPGEDTADAVTVEFFNSQTWKQDEVTVALPDSSAEQPAKVALFGCTGKAQAEREGLYMAAANRYRRRLISFQTELEGMIPTYGDLIAVSHDMPRWGQAGEVIAWAPPVLDLSEPVAFTPSGTHYLVLRRRDGSVSGPWEVLPGESEAQVVLQAEPDLTPFTGASEERTHFAFGQGQTWAVLARVVAVKPRGNLVEVSCVAENPLVHTADQI